ncbi:MAG: hypothetical protein JWN13_3918 [Betaproteobacteria bacterium]|jgi:hypothetical protein|nr:hypothetical protein [Betaproteobacteria bacterium]MEA3152879.1 hypothetical protein [Betaproteobacteria bacterium]
MDQTDPEFVAIVRVGRWKRFGVDIVELNNGTVLAINEEVIKLYANMEDLIDGDPHKGRPTIVR